MRGIKFRVWDKLANEYVAWNDFLNTRLVDNVFRGSKDMTLEQYTGLHDKDGKEIYEGDIVLAECNATLEKNHQIKIHKCEVVYSADFHGWRFPIIDMKPMYGATHRATNYFKFGHQGNALEVIGNIHEGVK